MTAEEEGERQEAATRKVKAEAEREAVRESAEEIRESEHSAGT